MVPALPPSAPKGLATLAASTMAALVQPTAAAGDCATTIPPLELYQADSGPVAAPVFGQVVSIDFHDLPSFADWAYPGTRLEVSADLGLKTERYDIRVNGGPWQTLWWFDETDCANPPLCSNWQPWIPFDQLGTVLLIEVRATTAVDPGSCPDGFVRFRFQYYTQGNPDCNGNGLPDACEIESGAVADCDRNGRPDACEVKSDPDSDCDANGIPDCCDFRAGSHDCDRNARLDSCDIALEPSLDCNANGLLDGCEVSSCLVTDVDLNRRPDPCDIADGLLADCNENGVADAVELQTPGNDLDGDFRLDDCDSPSADLYPNGTVGPEDLSILLGAWSSGDRNPDLDMNGIVGASDLTILLGAWGPVGTCGDGIAGTEENCCNCPSDARCPPGFDCLYGACVACPGGLCPPLEDDCEVLYGTAPGYGSRCCWSPPNSPCPEIPYGSCGCSGYSTGYGYEWNSCGYMCGDEYGYGGNGYTPCNRIRGAILICGIPVLGDHRGGNFAMTALTFDWSSRASVAGGIGLLGLLCLPLRRPSWRRWRARTASRGPSNTSP